MARTRSRVTTAGAATAAIVATLLVGALTVPAASAQTGFTSGDLVVYRVGNGSVALTSSSAPVFLDEWAPGTAPQSAPVFSLAMPTAAGTGTTPNPLVADGNASSEGGLTLSTDGTTLLVPGYDAIPGSTGSIASTTAAADPREVAEVDSAGDIDTTSLLGSTAFSGNNPRSAASVNGSTLWVGGAGGTEATQGGVWTTTKGSGTATSLTGGNFRWVEIYGAQLYASSGSATSPAVIGVNAIGIGLPVTTGQTVNNLSGVDSTSAGTPYAYYLLSEGGSGIDTAYVADNTVGVEKYSLISGAWTAEGSVALAGVSGLTGVVSGGTVTLFATTPSSLYQLSDPVGTATIAQTPAPTVLASAATNEAFRGVAFAPTPAPTTSVPESPLAVLLPLSALAILVGGFLVTRRRMLPDKRK